jgi:RNA polymerase sigma-70 factor (ECF subfamily)
MSSRRPSLTIPRQRMNRVTEPGSGERGPQDSSATSRSLLARVQADEAAAWDRLVGLYAPLVMHWCRRGGVQGQDAADIFQEVFRAVVTHVGQFRKEQARDTFRGWLRRITQNKVRDHYRRLGREAQGAGGSSAQDRLAQVPAAGFEDDPKADEIEERSLFARGLELIRGEFEERTWAAFWSTAAEGRSPKDVAEELSMTPGAVRVAKSRVLHRLREELGDLAE